MHTVLNDAATLPDKKDLYIIDHKTWQDTSEVARIRRQQYRDDIESVLWKIINLPLSKKLKHAIESVLWKIINLPLSKKLVWNLFLGAI